VLFMAWPGVQRIDLEGGPGDDPTATISDSVIAGNTVRGLKVLSSAATIRPGRRAERKTGTGARGLSARPWIAGHTSSTRTAASPGWAALSDQLQGVRDSVLA